MVALIGRLYYLQVIKSSEYKTISDSNRIRLMLLPPQRGKLLDRDGQVLAENTTRYRALLDPQFVKDKQQVIQRFAEVLSLSEKHEQLLQKKIRAHHSKRALIIYDNISWNELAKLEVHAPDLPGIMIDSGQIRYFPLGEISAHLIGYLGPVSEKEIKKNSLLNHPDFKIGRSGLEKALEQDLRGKAGVKRVEVDAYGLVVRELSRENSIQGKDVTLTINADLQEFVAKRMSGKPGSVVVLSVKTGEVLAMVSTPGFDSNLFAQGVPQDYWNTLLTDPDKPLIHRPVSNQMPPGSTFKTITALAAYKKGINPKQRIYCNGYVQVGAHRFHCWKKEGHGHMDMEHAIMHSCNSYFYKMSRQVGVDAIAEMAREFGLGTPTGLIVDNEKSGLIPTTQWKLKEHNYPWQVGDTLNVAIGQGYVLVTPIQLAQMAARIASARKISPSLLPTQGFTGFDPLNVDPDALALVQRGMYNVMNVPGGTAFGSRTKDKHFVIAGKTGTVQVISKKALKRIEKSLSKQALERTKNHAIFIGYGDVKDPDFAVSVVVEHGGGGSAAAAPVGRDVLKEARRLISS